MAINGILNRPLDIVDTFYNLQLQASALNNLIRNDLRNVKRCRQDINILLQYLPHARNKMEFIEPIGQADLILVLATWVIHGPNALTRDVTGETVIPSVQYMISSVQVSIHEGGPIQEMETSLLQWSMELTFQPPVLTFGLTWAEGS